MCVKWIVKSTRPLSITHDPLLKQYINAISGGRYTPPTVPTIEHLICQMSAASHADITKDVEALTADGVMPSVAADIWGENGVNLFGMMMYYIPADFKWTEKVCCRSALLNNLQNCPFVQSETVN